MGFKPWLPALELGLFPGSVDRVGTQRRVVPETPPVLVPGQRTPHRPSYSRVGPFPVLTPVEKSEAHAEHTVGTLGASQHLGYGVKSYCFWRLGC